MSGLVHVLAGLRPAASDGIAGKRTLRPSEGDAFGRVLEESLADGEGVRFSKHARARLRERAIDFTREDLGRLAEATDLAAAKGAREALLLMENVNVIVSIPNRTVVTAMAPDEGQVYTNIDAAVAVDGRSERR